MHSQWLHTRYGYGKTNMCGYGYGKTSMRVRPHPHGLPGSQSLCCDMAKASQLTCAVRALCLMFCAAALLLMHECTKKKKARQVRR